MRRWYLECLPDIAVCKVPPSNWFRMVDREDLSNNLFFQQQLPKDYIVLAISQDVANGEDL